ncbi:MAG TPA: hypothetical protein VG938_09915 [Verrucomicrobiae bacterium]|nr:hypothetical protein [Verrucomicrobiae bacterium]
MRIPDVIKKAVVFIGIQAEPGDIKFCGTGFFISMPSTRVPNHNFIYLITARHVVEGINGRDFYVRLNTKDGKSHTFQGDNQVTWWYHPNDNEHKKTDVAVYFMLFPRGLTQKLDFSAIPSVSILTDELIKSEGVGDGDEVCIAGLFSHHSGNEKNLPIIRTGNIAMMPDEPITANRYGKMESYLIECKSIGGLSGSPVFALKPTAVLLGNSPVQTTQWKMFLLGLIHGHFNSPENKMDTTIEDSEETRKMNVGIAIVTPAKKILEIINHEGLAKYRHEMEEKKIAENSSQPDKQ